jgi:quercetin dioxygenase-like cupin family protein
MSVLSEWVAIGPSEQLAALFFSPIAISGKILISAMHTKIWRGAMAEPMKRTILERFDVPDSDYETVIMHVEVAAQANTGLHTHPGFDAAYLLDGDLTVLERGQQPKPISPGQSWHVRPGVVHEVKAGNRPAKVLAMYVVEKGKPLATPWQPPQ